MEFKIDNNLKNTSGIYQITNLKNNKIYIGSAVNLSARYRLHKSDLKNNKHCNEYLQNAWNKYGQDNFIFELLELVKNKEDLVVFEQKWLDCKKCYNRNIGYNICSIAGNTYGVFAKPKTTYKLRYENPNSKIIIQCDFSGNIVNKWASLRDISRKLGYDSSSIAKCCKHKISYAYDYVWFYKEEFESTNFEIESYLLKAQKYNFCKNKDVRINQFDKNHTLIKTWDNIKQICNELDLLERSIKRCCDKTEKTYKGFIWEYCN